MGDDSDNDDEMVDFVDSSDDDNTGRGAGIGAGREEASDDPPLRAGPNATTMGFEFELCVAVATNTKMMPDPHPNDGRWISDHLIERSHESLSYKYTARNKLVDTLVAHGVPAQKNPENWYSEYGDDDGDFQWWDSLEYENPNQNDNFLMNWMGNYQWNGLQTDDENVSMAATELATQFWHYHQHHNLEVYMTRQALIESVGNNLHFMIVGVISRDCRERVKTLWVEQVIQSAREEKKSHYSAKAPPDPNLVPNLGVKVQYHAWSVTDDISILDRGPDRYDYQVPDGSVRVNALSGLPIGEPPDLYKWFGAEVISSVLDYDNPQTLRALRTVAKALRSELRIHKPMGKIETGVHVHIGQQAGWTLLHLKKFATLWHFIEPSMYTLHRRDRGYSSWCLPMTDGCVLARLVYGRQHSFARYGALTTGPKRSAYEMQMMQYLPDLGGRKRLREFLYHVWQYETLDDLKQGMGTTVFGTSCIRWRISGDKLSDNPDPDNIQTLEFRMMQGTLDADHIWKWASILERLVVFARDATDVVFRETMAGILEKTLPDSLGLNRYDLEWFRTRRTNEDCFAYPDNDAVDWSDPFMVPGYGDTHDRARSLKY
ncbi:hypothetical protein F4824DRAFT_504053 [Ustulina deusta]|nr:hypothetical protein F4824DRAFT_504053 [Ustulina deusta]